MIVERKGGCGERPGFLIHLRTLLTVVIGLHRKICLGTKIGADVLVPISFLEGKGKGSTF